MRYLYSDKVMYQKILSVSAKALDFSKPALNLSAKILMSKRIVFWFRKDDLAPDISGW